MRRGAPDASSWNTHHRNAGGCHRIRQFGHGRHGPGNNQGRCGRQWDVPRHVHRRYATTNDTYNGEATVTSTWTISSSCVTFQECHGTVTSDQGWSAPTYMI